MLPASAPMANESMVAMRRAATVPSISTRRWPWRAHTSDTDFISSVAPCGRSSYPGASATWR
jgi:hypothetical protein